MVISPWAPRGSVASELYDATSILKMIEWNWTLDNLNDRDLTATNLANSLTATKNTAVPAVFTMSPSLNASPPCQIGGGGEDDWKALHSLARSLGFPVGPYPGEGVPALNRSGIAVLIGGLIGAAVVVLGWRRTRS